ncbi:ImmA/IrrE family metallo-endopeptidase [Alloscardovia sp. HMSC034E08]|uniref:ImmA/IrrE family metallo-endopeptidase n=1 Tax=Alloscardovia sp. HMSC034E08 TaxID=1739413 RepID=UPI0008D34273|nr:ImmA/IrrE family metallo-endopeptidase [Alloscardovia sp. HMSC034E08]OFR00322.1 hypothetical protein HMPREF2909_04370 [Alloscardovia sp. HMSC034E08]
MITTLDLERIAEQHNITIRTQPLPAPLCGYYQADTQTIVLHDKLNDLQYKCTLAHELIHAEHHDKPTAAMYHARNEQRTRTLTALLLIRLEDYMTAERIYTGDIARIAAMLEFTIQVARDYVTALKKIAQPTSLIAYA